MTLVEQEGCLPYQRPPLSKDHLADGPDPVVHPLRGSSVSARNRIDLRCGAQVTAVDGDCRETRAAVNPQPAARS